MHRDALPARRGWRYFATRLNGDGAETLLDPDLPLEEVGVDDVLSGHNGLSGKIEPVYRRLKGSDGQPILREYHTAVYAENDGEIRGGGILTDSTPDGPTFDLECIGFTGYGIGLPYTGPGYKGIKVDPLDVARYIWRHIQNQPGGDIGLEFAPTTTGGKVKIGTELKQVEFDSQSGPVSFESGPYKLNWYTNHDLAGDLDDLASDTPFDYHERHFWDADGVLRHYVDLGYPKLGRRRDDLRFVYGANIFEPVKVSRAGALYASGTMVLGAGEGAAMVKSIREPVRKPGDRLRRVAVVADDTIKTTDRAAKRADRENQWRSKIDDVTSVLAQDHPNAGLGDAQVGDEIRIEGRGDWIDVDMWVRILAISMEPENGNVAEYTIARTDKLVD